jgi:hypothetical protein
VRVPEDAKPGKAVVRVEFAPGAKWRSFATELPFVIE